MSFPMKFPMKFAEQCKFQGRNLVDFAYTSHFILLLKRYVLYFFTKKPHNIWKNKTSHSSSQLNLHFFHLRNWKNLLPLYIHFFFSVRG